jgi:hypothetical protein
MGKVLVLKSYELYTDPAGTLSLQQRVGGPAPKGLPLQEQTQRTPEEVYVARRDAALTAPDLEGAPSPSEFEDPDLAAQQRRELAEMKRKVKAGEFRSHQERYGHQGYAGAVEGSRRGRQGPITEQQMGDARTAGERAGKVGVFGRRVGRGLAGALGGLSALTALEQAGASGAGLEQGLGSAAIRGMTTTSATSPHLETAAGAAGARLGAGSVGVQRRAQQGAERINQALENRRANRVAVAQPTVAQPTPAPTGPTPPSYEEYRGGLEAERAQLQRALQYNMPGTLPRMEQRLIGVERRLNPSTARQPFEMGMPYDPSIFEPVPTFNPASQAPGQPGQTTLSNLIGIQPPAQPTVAAPTTAATTPTTATGMAAPFMQQPQPQPQGQTPPADPTGGKDAAEAGAALAQKFSGKKQSMSDMEVEE